MTRHLRDLTSTENLLVVSSRFWFKAHMYRCNTPLILLRDVFKSANLSNSIRDFHSVMMAVAHMTKSKLSPNYQTPVTGVAEELLIKIIRLAQRGDDEELNTIFSKFFFGVILLTFLMQLTMWLKISLKIISSSRAM